MQLELCLKCEGRVHQSSFKLIKNSFQPKALYTCPAQVFFMDNFMEIKIMEAVSSITRK